MLEKVENIKPTLLRNANIINLYDGGVKENKDVVILSDRIIEVFDSSSKKDYESYEVIDCDQKFLMPGLWDMHIHILDNSDIAVPLFLANGVLGIRDMGSSFANIKYLKDKLEKENLPMNVFAAGPILDEQIIPGLEDTRINIAKNDALSVVKYLYDSKVDFIKVHSLVPYEKYCKLIKSAGKFKLDIAGHIPFEVKITECIEMGQKSIEHFTGVFLGCSSKEDMLQEKIINAENNFQAKLIEKEAADTFDESKFEEFIKINNKYKTYHVPTIRIFRCGITELIDSRPEFYDYISDELMEAMESFAEMLKKEKLTSFFDYMYEKNIELLERMHEKDVPIMVGTDSHGCMLFDQFKIFYGSSVHEEIRELVNGGYSNLEALQSAAVEPLKFLGLADEMGKIEEGKIADFLILNSNPLEDIENAKDIDSIVLKGKVKQAEDIKLKLE